jgi:hypothetical protein
MIYLLMNLNGAIVCELDVHFVAMDIQFMRKYIFNYYEFAKNIKIPTVYFVLDRMYMSGSASSEYLTLYVRTNYYTCLHVPFTWAKSILYHKIFTPKLCTPI